MKLLDCSCDARFSAGGWRTDGTVAARWTGVIGRVGGLGLVVALTFALLWVPFCIYPHDEDGGGCLSSLGQARSPTARVNVAHVEQMR